MDDLDALERVMLANLLEGRQPRRRSGAAGHTPRGPRQSTATAHRGPAVRRQSRVQGPARPAAAPARNLPESTAPRHAQRVLDIGRLIKQIDPRTTPQQRRDLAAGWARLDLTVAQVQGWLAAGVPPDQSALAAGCQERGLRPEDVKRRVGGVRVLERLRVEGPDSVMALLRGQAPIPRAGAAAAVPAAV